ncbi:MAG TPA: MBL fold metallo-hydrolase [Dehalococcoidia bacterium]|nr:MBL fold metallo-hydrolase [Dehalococcoidia bacterium]
MTVRFVGSGDAFGSGGRFQTCLYLEAGEARLLLDCGASSLVAMKRQGVDPGGIDTILISHLHGDHFGGVPFFILDAQFSRRIRPLTVAGPPGLAARLPQAMEALFPGSSQTQQKFDLRLVELPEREATRLGPVAVTPFQVVHASGAPPYALRVEAADRTVVYSGDTEWTDALIDAARGADLFICECYYFDKQVKFHLNYRTLMDQRNRLDCRRLVLTHLSNDMLARLADVQAEVEVAEDGHVVSL